MVKTGDYNLLWIDSLGNSTTEGGYETLCVEEASLRRLEVLYPWVTVTIVGLASDAGNGCKSLQTLLRLRNAKALTGILVQLRSF
jgi:hypothetical protein